MIYKHGIHVDGEWALARRSEESFFLEYWLTHFCQNDKKYCHRWGDNLDWPCSRCGSVCPEGLRGMYLLMTKL